MEKRPLVELAGDKYAPPKTKLLFSVSFSGFSIKNFVLTLALLKCSIKLDTKTFRLKCIGLFFWFTSVIDIETGMPKYRRNSEFLGVMLFVNNKNNAF